MSDPIAPLIALVCHGSRDSRATQHFMAFVRSCQQHLAPWRIVGCQLELADKPLALQLQSAVEDSELAAPSTITSTSAYSSTAINSSIIVVPILMAAGIHVSEDIPQEVAEAAKLCPQHVFHVTSPIGQTPQFLEVLTSISHAMPPCNAWILWGHGSRKVSFAREFASIGSALSSRVGNSPVEVAFAKQAPSLDLQVQHLYKQGYRQIGVLTGLLFPGWLSDRLAESARTLESELPQLSLAISPALMPHHSWVEAVRDLAMPHLKSLERSTRTAA